MLPTFLIIGGMKCGTSSLHYYLSLHPEVFMSTPKELDYFVLERNYNKGIKWYKSNFYGKAKAYGESSTNYTKYPLFKGVPERMHPILPNAKLIYLVRNPIDRIVSQYIHRICEVGKTWQEKRDIVTALTNLEHNHYVYLSKYYMQLEQYLKYYPKGQILIILTEELKSRRRAVMKKVFNFLGVDDSFYCPIYSTIYHKSEQKLKEIKGFLGRQLLNSETTSEETKETLEELLPIYEKCKKYSLKPPKLPSSLRERLIACLSDDLDSLRKFTGYNLKCWDL